MQAAHGAASPISQRLPDRNTPAGKGFQQTGLTVEDPVGRMDIREEMEMANRTVVHKSRRRGICIVLREVTIVLIGMGMQAFARIGREQDQQQRPRIEYPYEFCPLISGAKIMKKVTRQGALSQIPIYWDASAGNQISISPNPKHTLFLGYKRTQAPNLFEWSI